MNTFILAAKFLLRDYRAGELRILLLAIIVAVTGTTTVTLFADRLQQTMTLQAAEFLAADLVINSPTPAPPSWLQQAQTLQLQQASAVEFSSMLIENEQMLLASVKAVSSNYPLRGYLKTRTTLDSADSVVQQGPAEGEAWVEARILSALNLQLGDQLSVGEKSFSISRILSYEPDKRGDLYSMSPRVMLNSADLAATQVIQPGSHVHYLTQLAGTPEHILQFKQTLNPKLNPSQKLLDVHEDRPEVGGALQRAERYLSLSSIVVVLIAGVAIAMSARRYTERHFDTCAIMRCLGSTRRTIFTLYSYQLLLLGSIASLIGCILGLLLQLLLFKTLGSLLPAHTAPPSYWALALSFSSGLIILLSFALPPLLRLQNVSALRVLRRDMEPASIQDWLSYGCALLLISLLIWRYTQDLRMTVTIFGGSIVSLLLLSRLILGIFYLLHQALPRLPLHWRLSAQALLQNRRSNVTQIIAFSITFTAMLLSFTVKTDLINDWQQQLPANAPNHFALNIFSDQLAALQQDLSSHTQGESHYYPVVSGRLVQINGDKVQQHVTKDSQGQQATERDLSLTWSMSPPPDNQILDGTWWQEDRPGLVSVEAKLAQNLHIKLHDVLTFTVGNTQFTAEVASLRQVHWETMQPNFYMIFSPSSLNHFAHTFITSFFLPPEQKPHLNTLAKTYPNLTILAVDILLQQFKTVLQQLTAAIDYLFQLALLAGFTVLFAAIYSSLDERIYRGAILRTLGASSKMLTRAHLMEFGLLGAIAGVCASLLSMTLTYALYHFVLHLPYQADLGIYCALPVVSAGFIGGCGYLGLRNVIKHAPLQVLQAL